MLFTSTETLSLGTEGKRRPQPFIFTTATVSRPHRLTGLILMGVQCTLLSALWTGLELSAYLGLERNCSLRKTGFVQQIKENKISGN